MGWTNSGIMLKLCIDHLINIPSNTWKIFGDLPRKTPNQRSVATACAREPHLEGRLLEKSIPLTWEMDGKDELCKGTYALVKRSLHKTVCWNIDTINIGYTVIVATNLMFLWHYHVRKVEVYNVWQNSSRYFMIQKQWFHFQFVLEYDFMVLGAYFNRILNVEKSYLATHQQNIPRQTPPHPNHNNIAIDNI